MKNWTIAPITAIAIGVSIALTGCGGASNVKDGAVMAKEAPAKSEPAKMAKKSDGCTTALTFASATDDGTNDGHGPKMAIDGSTDPDSRWSSKSDGKDGSYSTKALTLKLASAQKIGAVGVAWYKGDERWTKFSIETSTDGKSYTTAVASRQSSGSSTGIEQYKFTPVDAMYVRINTSGNESSAWNSLTEAKAFGC